jgi:hypothetical protein
MGEQKVKSTSVVRWRRNRPPLGLRNALRLWRFLRLFSRLQRKRPGSLKVQGDTEIGNSNRVHRVPRSGQQLPRTRSRLPASRLASAFARWVIRAPASTQRRNPAWRADRNHSGDRERRVIVVARSCAGRLLFWVVSALRIADDFKHCEGQNQ